MNAGSGNKKPDTLRENMLFMNAMLEERWQIFRRISGVQLACMPDSGEKYRRFWKMLIETCMTER